MENKFNSNNYGHNTHPRDWDDAQLINYIVENGILTTDHVQRLNPTTKQMVRLIEKFEEDAE
jgi:hypothetical protein